MLHGLDDAVTLKRVDASPAEVGVVVIGRNEGARLTRCLASALASSHKIVYVDSGSSDGSPELAAGMGVDVLGLDLTVPFTAARARNEGFARLMQLHPKTGLVQFIDGDCELAPGWLRRGCEFLGSHSDAAAACGRRRERFPERSIYNRLCDLEWDTPIGECRAVGGDAMVRADALRAVGGYRSSLIAGEEPELCVRLRAAGWRIWRLDEEMTLHDAAMTKFGQWWRRTLRAGYAFAAGAHLHGAPPERHWVRESRRAMAWGLALPLAIALAVALWGPWASAALLIYPAQVGRLFARTPEAGATNVRLARAGFLVLSKFPEAIGGLRFWMEHWVRGPGRLIEYK